MIICSVDEVKLTFAVAMHIWRRHEHCQEQSSRAEAERANLLAKSLIRHRLYVLLLSIFISFV